MSLQVSMSFRTYRKHSRGRAGSIARVIGALELHTLEVGHMVHICWGVEPQCHNVKFPGLAYSLRNCYAPTCTDAGLGLLIHSVPVRAIFAGTYVPQVPEASSLNVIAHPETWGLTLGPGVTL